MEERQKVGVRRWIHGWRNPWRQCARGTARYECLQQGNVPPARRGPHPPNPDFSSRFCRPSILQQGLSVAAQGPIRRWVHVTPQSSRLFPTGEERLDGRPPEAWESGLVPLSLPLLLTAGSRFVSMQLEPEGLQTACLLLLSPVRVVAALERERLVIY